MNPVNQLGNSMPAVQQPTQQPAPQPVAPPVLEAPSTIVTFSGNVKFGAASDGNAPRTGLKGFFAAIGRFFNRLVQGAHQSEDEAMRKNPLPFLTTKHNELIDRKKKIQEGYARIIGKFEVQKAKLEEFKKAELKEKKEALAAAEAMKSLAETDADYAAQKEYAEQQALEWKVAKEKVAAQQTLISQLDVEAEESRHQMREVEAQTKELLAKIEKAALSYERNALKRQVLAMSQEVKDLANGQTFSDQTLSLINHIEEESATLDVQLSGGKTKEQRAAELRAKNRARVTEASDALSELLAEESKATEEKK